MRGPALFSLALLFIGCVRPPEASEAAVHVQASYDFRAGCIVVEARDKAAPDKSQSERIVVGGRTPPAKVSIAVYRGQDWGSTLEIIVSAHEQKCDGAEVARAVREYTLKKAGVQTLEVALSAPDADGDAYVASSAGGTDCDDNDVESNPGVTAEVCDGRDNDCRNGMDDGLAVTDFFPDADGDGVGAGTAVKACATPPGHAGANGDCDDNDGARAPGKFEVCDDVDNNCNTLVDEGLATSPFYRDMDGDGFGDQAVMVQKCRIPAGYVVAGSVFDCMDSNAGVNPNSTELCNDLDDNCVGGIDEGFTPQKGTVCDTGGCPGTNVCNATQTGTVCSALPPVSYYPDVDKDTEGDANAAVETRCPPAAAPPGKVTNKTDCDDWDPYNRSGGMEVCDDRDNNCAGGKADEAAVCAGKGWKVLTSPTVPNARDWRTVAVGPSGSPVWIAGAAGALAWRASASSGNFTEFHQKCGNVTWNAAWVRPSDGSVFLAGDGGYLAMYTANDASCTTVLTGNASGGTTSNHPIMGIMGFEVGSTTTVYAVNAEGRVFSWSPGNAQAAFKLQRTSRDPYQDIHGVAPSKLLLAAVISIGDFPQIDGYDSVGNTRTTHTLSSIPLANNYSLRGIWAWDSTHAYAVGKKGNLLLWDGGTTWYFANVTPTTMQVDLNSIVALDLYSAYVASQDGKIRRPVITGWVEHYTATGALKDIAAVSREDIWAVGNGIVVHFE